MLEQPPLDRVPLPYLTQASLSGLGEHGLSGCLLPAPEFQMSDSASSLPLKSSFSPLLSNLPSLNDGHRTRTSCDPCSSLTTSSSPPEKESVLHIQPRQTTPFSSQVCPHPSPTVGIQDPWSCRGQRVGKVYLVGVPNS